MSNWPVVLDLCFVASSLSPACIIENKKHFFFSWKTLASCHQTDPSYQATEVNSYRCCKGLVEVLMLASFFQGGMTKSFL